jgi:NAD-dependent deacetylase
MEDGMHDRTAEDQRAARIEGAAGVIARSRRLVALTGAGISQESGIPTFRGTEGVWGSHRPEDLATREGFLGNPGLAWRWYRERRAAAREREPNAAHIALRDLEQLIPSFLLVTQNVDNLHRAAGSMQLIELHGNIGRYRCMEYGHPAPEEPSWGDEPPRCRCGSVIRPDVVWFGEPLPQAELACAFRESQLCDCLLVVGTSGIVEPAALLPAVAKQSGAALIEVNISPSGITPIADIFLEGPAAEVLPAVVSRVRTIRAGELLAEQ